MTNQKNPWNIDRLSELLGQDEHTNLEFKSSQGFKNKKDFISDIARGINAFINTDGGILIVGIDEVPSKENPKVKRAEKIEGVTKSVISADTLSRTIYSLISPSAGSLIKVFPIKVSPENDGTEKYAFAIEVAPGHTAYQLSVDKIYYGRRGAESVPLEDKDVRLRMISDDKSRVELSHSWSISGNRNQVWEEYEKGFASKRACETEIKERRLASERLSESEGQSRANEVAALLAKGNLKFITPVFNPHKMVEAGVDIDIHVRNSGYAKIEKLCMSFATNNLSLLKWGIINDIRTNKFGDQVYLEKNFTSDGGISLYPGMTIKLFSFYMKLKRDKPLPPLPEFFEFHVYLDNGVATSLSIALSRIAEECAIEFEQKASEIEGRFIEIKPDVQSWRGDA